MSLNIHFSEIILILRWFNFYEICIFQNKVIFSYSLVDRCFLYFRNQPYSQMTCKTNVYRKHIYSQMDCNQPSSITVKIILSLCMLKSYYQRVHLGNIYTLSIKTRLLNFYKCKCKFWVQNTAYISTRVEKKHIISKYADVSAWNGKGMH